VTIRIGGDYATLTPEHAGLVGADQVVCGRIPSADRCLPLELDAVGCRLGFALFAAFHVLRSFGLLPERLIDAAAG